MENKWISRHKLQEDIEKGIYYTKNSIKCETCGHTMFLGRKDKKVCTWCGRYVFKDKKEEFMYRLGEHL